MTDCLLVRARQACCIRFEDASDNLGDVHVHPLYRRQQMIGELRRCGFHVEGDVAGAASR